MPFWPSIASSRTFLLADNTLGFVPFVVPAALYIVWIRGHPEMAPSRRDLIIDAFFAIPLLAAGVAILIISPSTFSWYFWLYRMDLLSLAFVATAAAVVFFGYQQVLRMWPAITLLFVGWPYVLIKLEQAFNRLLIPATSAIAESEVRLLRLPYAIEHGADTVFTATAPSAGSPVKIILSQACSGSASTMGFLVVGFALGAIMHGPIQRRLLWLGLGLALAFAANTLRVGVLLTLAVWWEDFAVSVVHPILGLVFFIAVLVLMLLLLRRLGLSLQLTARGGYAAWDPAAGGGRVLNTFAAATAGIALLAVAPLVVDVQHFGFLGENGASTVTVSSQRSILPEVEGWTLEHRDRLDWRYLFGPSSSGDVFMYRYPDGPHIVAQVIVADSKTALDRYPVERCLVFHGEDISKREYISLPHGTTGLIIHHDDGIVPSAVLAWQFPILVRGSVRHARVMLILDADQPTKTVSVAALDGPAITQRVGVGLRNRFNGVDVKDDPRLQIADAELVELASAIVSRLVSY